MAPAAGVLTFGFKHSILYTTEEPVPVADIAESLLALDRIVRRLPQVMRELVPGISLPKVELLVEKIETGSLLEDVVVKFFFGSERKLNRAIKRFREKLGVDLTTAKGTLRALLWGLVLVGGGWAASHYLGTPSKPTIEISHNTIINIGAKESNMTPDALVKVIETAVANKNQLAADAVKVIKPAKADPKAEIVVDGTKDLKISNEIILKVPAEFNPDKSEESAVLQHAEVHVRALDLDSNEHGWAATVPSVSPRRLPLEIGPGINPEDLFGKKIIKGTIEKISRRDPYGKMQLREYRLSAVDPEDGAQE